MADYKLSIITPNGRIFDDRVESLTASGATGSFGVLASHAPMITSLRRGPLTLRKDGNEQYFAVSTGILEINGDHDVLLLADDAVPAETMDEAKVTANNFESN